MNTSGLIDIGANLTHPQLYNQLDEIVSNIIGSETDSEPIILLTISSRAI